MSSSARIDELRKKFDENPRRFFAPLANEYRKAGDFEQAVFICQEYLPQQPGHMSGHIVYGQTLFDMGRDEEAKAVFETALTLDPENLIALKHLGDIARQAGDLEGARNWYQRVLEADPRNDEIMVILESMGGLDSTLSAGAGAETRRGGETPLSSPTVVDTPHMTHGFVDLPPEAGTEAADEADDREPIEAFVIEQSVDAEMPIAEPDVAAFPGGEEPSAAHASAGAPATDEAEHELLDLDDFSFGAPADSTPAAAEEPPPLPESAFVAESARDVEPEAAMFVDAELSVDARAAEPEPISPPPEPNVELATDVILGLTSDEPDHAAEESLSDLQVEEAPVAGEDLSRAIDQLEGLESFSMDLPVEEATSAAVEDSASPAPAADTFATETMAELYAQQGHLESAMEIYDQLLERSPDDAELRRRANEVERQFLGPAESASTPVDEIATAAVDEEHIELPLMEESIEPAAAGPTIREFFAEILYGRRGVEDAATVDDSAFGGELLAGEPEGSLDILFSDEPTADADLSAAMSLAQAFGEAECDEAAALQGTPAHPASDELSLDHVFRSATPAKGTPAAGAFSLDQFFSGEPGSGGAEEAGESPAPRSTDDIAQFNAWLNGLKKT
jgi:tetratricopeptide (TPR) repeat protein